MYYVQKVESSIGPNFAPSDEVVKNLTDEEMTILHEHCPVLPISSSDKQMIYDILEAKGELVFFTTDERLAFKQNGYFHVVTYSKVEPEPDFTLIASLSRDFSAKYEDVISELISTYDVYN